MPNRIIRESCRTSQTLDVLSAEAERMFWRLTTVADDFGRFEAEPPLLVASCFPLKIGQYQVSRVERWFQELAQELVQVYQANGKRYGVFKKWDTHQNIRAKRSKYPPPTNENICKQMLASDSKCLRDLDLDLDPDPIHTPPTPPQGGGFVRFWSLYPKKKSKGHAEQTWRKLFAQRILSEPLLETVYASIERAKTSEAWTKEHGRFIPYPATWLNARGWEDEETPKSLKTKEQQLMEQLHDNKHQDPDA